MMVHPFFLVVQIGLFILMAALVFYQRSVLRIQDRCIRRQADVIQGAEKLIEILRANGQGREVEFLGETMKVRLDDDERIIINGLREKGAKDRLLRLYLRGHGLDIMTGEPQYNPQTGDVTLADDHHQEKPD